MSGRPKTTDFPIRHWPALPNTATVENLRAGQRTNMPPVQSLTTWRPRGTAHWPRSYCRKPRPRNSRASQRTNMPPAQSSTISRPWGTSHSPAESLPKATTREQRNAWPDRPGRITFTMTSNRRSTSTCRTGKENWAGRESSLDWKEKERTVWYHGTSSAADDHQPSAG